MGHLLHIPTPYQVLTLTREIETATVSTWDNDPALKASGSLGVVTREIAYPQPGDSPHRDYGGKADVPALWCWCRFAGFGEAPAVATYGLQFDLMVGAVDEDASSKAGIKSCSDVITVGTMAVLIATTTTPSTWIASELHTYVPDKEFNVEAPQPRPNKPDRFEALASIQLTVLWTREVMN